ncbi:restriction endonuclease [Telmatobacter bradus]|uniref:restriction endonuclease n=1 Tax=Telmatobacter bradus TaxID=474953 RepID=UPI003B436C2C
MTDPKWKRFEKLIHGIHTQFAPEGATVTLDDEIVGYHSKVPRQIDVSIRVRVAQYPVLMIIECKDHSRPIDVAELGAFVSLRDDVRANQGVIISTSGFTPAAIEMARGRGIVTRTYIDTESLDWNTDISIPVILARVMLHSWAVTFSNPPGFAAAIPTNIPFPFIETFAEDGTPLGPIIVLLGKKWNHDENLHLPGEHSVILADHVLVYAGSTKGHVRIVAKLRVERRYYKGPLRISVAGFRDDQDGSILTKELKTDFVEPAAIERGDAPGWSEVTEIRNYIIDRIEGSKPDQPKKPTIEGVPLEAMLVMHYIDALPENPEEVRNLQTADGYTH